MIKITPANGGITVELSSTENGRTVSCSEFVAARDLFYLRWAIGDAGVGGETTIIPYELDPRSSGYEKVA